MLNFDENQLTTTNPQTLQINQTKITITSEFGQKQVPILRLPRASLGQMMSTYQYQFEIEQFSDKQLQTYLYILKDYTLNLFKTNIAFDKDISSQEIEKIQQMAFDNYTMAPHDNEDITEKMIWSGKNNKSTQIKIHNENAEIKAIEKTREAKFPRSKTMKLNIDIQQTENGFSLVYLINQMEQETEIGFQLKVQDGKKEDNMEVEPLQLQKQDQQQIQSQFSFPQMNQSHKKERAVEQNFGFQNSSFFINSDTRLLREIEKYSQDNGSQQENKPHNLRRRKLTNYSTMGQEEEDDSTCENSSEVDIPNQPKQKKQKSRKSSYQSLSNINNNSLNSNNNLITIHNNSNNVQSMPAIQYNCQQQQLPSFSALGSSKPSPMKHFGQFPHMEEDESYSLCSSTQVSHKSSASKKKGDKKNVVKNFTKAFSKFVTNDEYAEEIQSIINGTSTIENFRAQWKEFFYKPKFNNKLIKELILNKKFHDVFDLFLQKHAYDWLMNQSSVEDKESHLDVLKDYIKASSRPDEIENIVILKCRN